MWGGRSKHAVLLKYIQTGKTSILYNIDRDTQASG